ncbi:uncharacterized protein [Dermacentor albipictus]|uniref:uncharacterized protein n=1 Tax=Dermacentor albipictus TaxID=60249 RepID=UPI0038FC670E
MHAPVGKEGEEVLLCRLQFLHEVQISTKAARHPAPPSDGCRKCLKETFERTPIGPGRHSVHRVGGIAPCWLSPFAGIDSLWDRVESHKGHHLKMASTMRSQLSFTCVWTQKPCDDVEAFMAAYVQFFEVHQVKATLSIGRCRQQKTYKSDCEDPIWLVEISLNLHSRKDKNQLESLSVEIARQWCASGLQDERMSRYLQWLQPDRKFGFWHGWYNIEEGIKMNSIAFGTFVGLNLFAERHAIVSNSAGEGYNIDCTFKHGERTMQVFIELSHCMGTTDVYRLSLSYNNIFCVVVHDPDGGPTDVFLHVHTLPLFHKAVDNVGPFYILSHAKRPKSRDQMDFERTLKIGCAQCGQILESRDVGGCFVIRLSFSDRHMARRTIGRLSRRCRRALFSFAAIKTHPIGRKAEELRQQLCARIMPKLKFRCCYALNALIQRSDDIIVQLMLLEKCELDTLLKDLESYASHNEGALEEVLFNIGSALENHCNITFAAVLPELFKKFCKTYLPTNVPRGSCLVRRLFVTPSRIFFLPPALHAENRVIRRFDVDYALRVSFRDDHFELLSHTLGSHGERLEMLDEVVGGFLRNGITIGDRHFKLLASSVSQLRDHGVWLYANDCHGNSVESIRAWMGDFSAIPSVAKKIARMGQCFSTTEESVIVPLHGEIMQDAPDIEGGVHPISGKPYVFSDGIGIISESLMKKVCAKLDMVQVPSAIQIRYAGYKGMLCTNNALQGDKLILRKSMNKFACITSASIEVIKVSAPSQVFLNRPLITILEQLNVPRRVFLHLQQNMLLQLCDAFVNDGAALRVLGTYTNTSLPYAKLHVNGMSLSQEPFTRSMILVVYQSMIAGLKEKSRIAIPPEKGRNMLGVLDETATLAYGQVFVQFTHMGVDLHNGAPNSGDCNRGSTQVLTAWTVAAHPTPGTVLVTKCPCLHPGDVRKFEAVDVPALHHIRDCIVFPAKGPRPHPNEMAGSDLDGDEYIVIWEPDLFFPGSNREPMVFSDTSIGAPSTGNLVCDSFLMRAWSPCFASGHQVAKTSYLHHVNCFATVTVDDAAFAHCCQGQIGTKAAPRHRISWICGHELQALIFCSDLLSGWDLDYPCGNHYRFRLRPSSLCTFVLLALFIAPFQADSDIIRFLCQYILNDSVGVMSNAHLAWADQLPDGICSSTCLALAEKISTCLDFAKTGISAQLSRHERVQKYPDFMAKRGIKPTYRSARVLGELYRLNKTLISSIWHTLNETDFHCNLFDYPGWQKHRHAAESARNVYEVMMWKIMDQYGIESEAEVVAGIINSVSRYNKSKLDKTSVETLVSKQYQDVTEAMQKQFVVDVEVASRQDQSQRTTLLEMASAWYMVTCSDRQFKKQFLGLPWCIVDSLLLLLRERSCAKLTDKPVSQNLLAAKINQQSFGRSPEDDAFDMLCAWARNEDLLCDTVTKASQVCMSCLKQAFQQFVSSSQCSTEAPVVPSIVASQGDSVKCGQTAGDYVCGFLRYLTMALTVLPLCNECSSPSGQVYKLTLAALHRYSRLAISRDVCCFDLPCDPKLHDSTEDVQESDPIRINVQTTQFLGMLREQEDLVKQLLCRWTGVEQVNIHLYSYRSRKYHYFIVTAVGRQWQLCCFDELIAQPWLENAIINRRLG